MLGGIAVLILGLGLGLIAWCLVMAAFFMPIKVLNDFLEKFDAPQWLTALVLYSAIGIEIAVAISCLSRS